jgi:hypothetical protein
MWMAQSVIVNHGVAASCLRHKKLWFWADHAHNPEVFAQLVEEANTSLQLPDPSPPTGNGAAYGKFLDMYNELRGLAPVLDAEG